MKHIPFSFVTARLFYPAIAIFIAAVALYGCKPVNKTVPKQQLIEEIKKAEADFMNDLKTNGVEHAFYTFAAPDAAVKRGKDSLIIGNEAIKHYYSADVYKNAVAEWTPDFVDVSDDGTLAYTYGHYKWTITDADNKVSFHEGVFHTVWKRMPDNSWKYVWD